MEFWRTRFARKCFSAWHASVFKSIFHQLYFVQFFLSRRSIDSFLLKGTVSFWMCLNLYSTLELETWLGRCCKSAVSSDIPQIANSYFSKTTTFNSYLKISIDAFIQLYGPHTKEPRSFCLDWPKVFHYDLHRQFFSPKNWFFNINFCIFNLLFLRRF